jgi:hypothetical protein
MKQEHKYYVEWTVNDQLYTSEVILGVKLPLTKRFPYIKYYVKKYWERITETGTKVVVRSVVYKGTVLRIS